MHIHHCLSASKGLATTSVVRVITQKLPSKGDPVRGHRNKFGMFLLSSETNLPHCLSLFGMENEKVHGTSKVVECCGLFEILLDGREYRMTVTGRMSHH